jgi:hypothetical protein
MGIIKKTLHVIGSIYAQAFQNDIQTYSCERFKMPLSRELPVVEYLDLKPSRYILTHVNTVHMSFGRCDLEVVHG